MRALVLVVLFAVAVGACDQSLAPNKAGTGGVITGAGGLVGGGVGGFVGGNTGGSGGTTAGTGGLGGSSVAPNCDSLMAEYQWYMPLATSCTVGISDQCQQPISAGLTGCSCTYVNDTTLLTTIAQAWQTVGCGMPVPACNCPTAGSYACLSPDGGVDGYCTYLSGGITGTGGASPGFRTRASPGPAAGRGRAASRGPATSAGPATSLGRASSVSARRSPLSTRR